MQDGRLFGARLWRATTALGALIFFWARLIYAVIYLLGMPWLRTLAWVASVIGMVIIALQLI